jgi:hypothetical protein
MVSELTDELSALPGICESKSNTVAARALHKELDELLLM